MIKVDRREQATIPPLVAAKLIIICLHDELLVGWGNQLWHKSEPTFLEGVTTEEQEEEERKTPKVFLRQRYSLSCDNIVRHRMNEQTKYPIHVEWVSGIHVQ